MSKRQATAQGGQDRYGGPDIQEEMAEKPKQATAAQLANRKIANMKGRRPRSESPLPPNPPQAMQNGFGNNNMNASNPFSTTPNFSFGNSSANGTTQSFGSGGGSFTFGQQTQQSTPNTNSSFTFGNNNTQANPFQSGAQTPQTPQTNGFGGNTSFTFGQQPNQQSNTLFSGGAEVDKTASAQNTNAPQGLFGNAADATPKPVSNIFGAQDQTPKQSSFFGAVQPTSNVFSSGVKQNGSIGFTFDKPASENSSSTPFAGFGATQGAQNAQSDKPANNGWGSLLNKPEVTSKPTTNGFNPSTTSIFGQGSTSNPSASSLSATNTTAKTSPFNFSAQPVDNDASMMSPENTPQKPSTGIFGALNGTTNSFAPQTSVVEEAPKSTFEAGKGPSLFDRITKEPPSQPASSLFSASSSVAPEPPLQSKSQLATTSTSTQTSMSSTKSEHFVTIRELNEALLQHLQTQDLNKNLTSIFQYYQDEITKIQGGRPASTTASSPAPVQPSNMVSSSVDSGASILGKSASTQPSKSLFGKPANASQSSHSVPNLFNKAAEKPASQPEYPSLSGSGSTTSKLFEAAMDKPTEQTPLTKSVFTPAAPSNASQPFGVKSDTAPSTAAPVAALPKMPSFTPSVATNGGGSFLSSFGKQAAANEEKEKKRRRDEDFDSDEDDPAEWDKKDAEEQAQKRAKIQEASKSAASFTFKPSGTMATSSAFNFGKTSESTTKQAAVEEPSSTEDHTWKQGTPIKFGGAAVASTTPAAASKSNIFGAASTTPAAAPKSNIFGAANTPAAAPKASLFSSSTSSSGPTPNIFSATTPVSSAGAGLFGSSNPPAGSNGTSSIFAGLNKPAQSGFTFGQSSTSASASAPTPNKTDTNDAEEEGEAAPLDPQQDDMAVLLPAEREANDIIYHVEKVKARKMELRPAEGGNEKYTWVEKGLGPLWILRDKSTGKVRVLQKIKDSGRAAMNFPLLPGDKQYNLEPSGKMVTGTFIDHLSSQTPVRPSKWVILVGKKEVAEELVKVLQEQQPKA